MPPTRPRSVQGEAQHWIERKNHLPEQVAQMERDYQALRGRTC